MKLITSKNLRMKTNWSLNADKYQQITCVKGQHNIPKSVYYDNEKCKYWVLH